MKSLIVILFFISFVLGVTSNDVPPDYDEYAFSISWMSKLIIYIS